MEISEKLKFLENAILTQFGKTVSLEPTTSLLDIGLDSLDIVELQMYYEDTVGVEIMPSGTIVYISDLLEAMK